MPSRWKPHTEWGDKPETARVTWKHLAGFGVTVVREKSILIKSIFFIVCYGGGAYAMVHGVREKRVGVDSLLLPRDREIELI